MMTAIKTIQNMVDWHLIRFLFIHATVKVSELFLFWA